MQAVVRQPKRSMAAARSWPRTWYIWSRPNWSWPAGTGVWVVKTHCWRTASTSASVACAERRAGELLLEQADGEQRGVALVHVVDLGFAAECVEQRDAAEAEHGLLAEAVVGVAAVEVVGEAAVVEVVAFDVGVEQEDGDDVAGDAHDVEAPGADARILRPCMVSVMISLALGQRGLGRPGDVGLGLLAEVVEVLAEVAAAMHQGDGDHGRRRCRPPSAGCRRRACRGRLSRWEAGREGDLHGEVRDSSDCDIRGGVGESGG